MSARLFSGAARLAGSSLLRLQTDERLVALARSGHPPAFAAIVERYRDELVRYAERLVGSSRAEDVVQQAFLNAHLAMPSANDDLKLRPWLYRIAHNVAVNVLRAARPQAVLDDRVVAPGALDEDLETRERLQAALAAIARLPEPQRDALTLRAIEGRPQEEVAAALGLSEGAARQQVHRARMTLRAAVSAITPYGLVARFAMAGTSSGISPAELTAGGAGAAGAVTKAAAAMLAAGALAGGATQLPATSQRDRTPRPAQANKAPAATPAPAAEVTTDRSAATPARDDRGRHRGADDSTSRHRRQTEPGDDHRGSEHRGESDDDSRSGPGPGSGDDRLSSSGPGSGDDHVGSGESGSGESGSGGDDELFSSSGSDDVRSPSSGPGPGGTAPLSEVDDSITSGTSGTSGSDSSGSGSGSLDD